jgi:hypothetical protein
MDEEKGPLVERTFRTMPMNGDIKHAIFPTLDIKIGPVPASLTFQMMVGLRSSIEEQYNREYNIALD